SRYTVSTSPLTTSRSQSSRGSFTFFVMTALELQLMTSASFLTLSRRSLQFPLLTAKSQRTTSSGHACFRGLGFNSSTRHLLLGASDNVIAISRTSGPGIVVGGAVVGSVVVGAVVGGADAEGGGLAHAHSPSAIRTTGPALLIVTSR